jgi:hypothetical protein
LAAIIRGSDKKSVCSNIWLHKDRYAVGGTAVIALGCPTHGNPQKENR